MRRKPPVGQVLSRRHNDGNDAIHGPRLPDDTGDPIMPVQLYVEDGEVGLNHLVVRFALPVEVLDQLISLDAVPDCFDSLLQSDGDEQADDDGGDMDEEVAPGGGGVVGGVDV